jgi:hypothetical protein
MWKISVIGPRKEVFEHVTELRPPADASGEAKRQFELTKTLIREEIRFQKLPAAKVDASGDGKKLSLSIEALSFKELPDPEEPKPESETPEPSSNADGARNDQPAA